MENPTVQKIITDANATELLVTSANDLGKQLSKSLTTSQIRAIFGEMRQIQALWGIEGQRSRALRRLILLKPKMAYRARKDRPVQDLVAVLDPALDAVVKERDSIKQDENFKRFVDFFEAILAYHKAHGARS